MLDPLYVGDIITSTLHGSPFPDFQASVYLLLGTVAVESEFLDLPERGERPGIGYFQLTPACESALWRDYLQYNVQLKWWFVSHAGQGGPHPQALTHNLSYQVLVARVLYYRRTTGQLPAPEEVAAQAQHWRRYWRQSDDQGLEQAYVEAYTRLVVPHYPLHRVRKGG